MKKLTTSSLCNGINGHFACVFSEPDGKCVCRTGP